MVIKKVINGYKNKGNMIGKIWKIINKIGKNLSHSEY